MSEKTCQSCTHYRQHYGKDSVNCYHPLNCGHCTYPRLKNRKPLTAACEYYAERIPEDNSDDSLTKDTVFHWLLQHLSDL